MPKRSAPDEVRLAVDGQVIRRRLIIMGDQIPDPKDTGDNPELRGFRIRHGLQVWYPPQYGS